MLTIVVADPSEIVREGVAGVLKAVPGFSVVDRVACGRQLTRAVATWRPAIVVTAAKLRDEDIFEVAEKIRNDSPATRIIIMTAEPGEVHFAELVDAGISGWVLLGSKVEHLVSAVRKAALNSRYVSPDIVSSVRSYSAKIGKNGGGLSPREKEVLKLIGEGYPSKDIAAMLRICETTVKTYRNNLMDKLDVRNVAGLTREAVRLRLVRVDKG